MLSPSVFSFCFCSVLYTLSFFRDPIAQEGWTIRKLDTITLASYKKRHYLAGDERHFSEIKAHRRLVAPNQVLDRAQVLRFDASTNQQHNRVVTAVDSLDFARHFVPLFPCLLQNLAKPNQESTHL
jgi:hypothetical protein